jgi:excisionase family DNA binding protein
MAGRPAVLIQVYDKYLFRRTEAARFLGMSPHHLDKLTAERKIPAYSCGERKKYRIDDLMAYVDSLEEAS